jgi:hypothetical protein
MPVHPGGWYGFVISGDADDNRIKVLRRIAIADLFLPGK